jgi:hypothetical protein
VDGTGHQQAAAKSDGHRNEHGADAGEVRNRIECHRKISTVSPNNLHANQAFHGKKLFLTRAPRVPSRSTEHFIREPNRDRTVIIKKEREPDGDRKVIIDRR